MAAAASTLRATAADVFDAELATLDEFEASGLEAYRDDPVAYAHDRLGVEFLPQQAALAYAVAGQWHKITPEMAELAELENPGHRKIAVSSGQKTGKSLAIVCLALWFYECFDEARAMMTAAKGDQIRAVLWRELEKVLLKSPQRPAGKCSPEPFRGMKSPDKLREVRGFNGRTIESIAGISGVLLYFVDEASHLDQKRAEVVDGNTAGETEEGAPDSPIVYTSQPTRSEGPFFDAFHSQRDTWTRMTFDSEKIAQWCARRGIRRKGVVSPRRVEEWKRDYGEDSPFFLVRVKGRFLRNETGKVISMHLLEEAEERWTPTADSEEPLEIGYDPAGPGNAGDEHAFALKRGYLCLGLHTRRGLSEDAACDELYALMKIHRRPGEVPRIKIDAEGMIGTAIYTKLRVEAERRRLQDPENLFEVHGVRSSSKYVRDPTKFERVRDEMWWVLALWLAEGGAIPRDPKLEGELYAPAWIGMPDGRIKVTPKIDLREFLGRSPDRADGLALAVWRPVVAVITEASAVQAKGPMRGYEPSEQNSVYDWEKAFRR